MKHSEAIARIAAKAVGSGIRITTATVSIAPAAHLVGVNLGDGITLTINYSAALTLSVGDVVLVLADNRVMFACFKVA